MKTKSKSGHNLPVLIHNMFVGNIKNDLRRLLENRPHSLPPPLGDRIHAYKSSVAALLHEIEYISPDLSTKIILFEFRVAEIMCTKTSVGLWRSWRMSSCVHNKFLLEGSFAMV